MLNATGAGRLMCDVRELSRAMTSEQFWAIVEDVHGNASGNMDRKCELLEQRLRELPLDEVCSFEQHFRDCEHRAYSWELWAAAYIIGHGCSDDKFSDFRSTLISHGQEIFEKTLADPQLLADVGYDADSADYEGYQYVATKVYRDRGGGQAIPSLRSHPGHPSGRDWDEARVAELYPKLAAKYGYKDWAAP